MAELTAAAQSSFENLSPFAAAPLPEPEEQKEGSLTALGRQLERPCLFSPEDIPPHSLNEVERQMQHLDALADGQLRQTAIKASDVMQELCPPRVDALEEPLKVQSVPPDRSVVFEGQIVTGLIDTPPITQESRKSRCFIVYLVAMGLARLHQHGLCHMNVNANHVELGIDQRSGALYGRLADGDSVVPIGNPAKRLTPSYLDLALVRSTHTIVANPQHDLW